MNPSSFNPKTEADMVDLTTRLDAATKLLQSGIMDTLTKVEQETQIKFLLGLDRNNPYAIIPTWVPQNVKSYDEEQVRPSDSEGTASNESVPVPEPQSSASDASDE